jgi:hypothetical protein
MSLQKNIGDLLAPTIKVLVDIAIEVVNSISNWIKENSGLAQSILFIGSIVAGVVATFLASGGLYFAFVAMKGAVIALAVAIKGALVAAFAFLMANPIVALIVGAVALIILLAKETIKYWSQIEPAVRPLINMFLELASQIKVAIAPIIEFASKAIQAARSMMNMGEGAEDTGGEIAILGTIAKVVLGSIVLAIMIVVDSFKLLFSTIKTLGVVLGDLWVSLKAGMAWDFTTANAAIDRVKNNVTALGDEFRASGNRIAAQIRNMTDPVRTLGGEISNTKEKLKEFGEIGSKSLEQTSGKAGKVAESIETANHPLREFVKSMATLSGESAEGVTGLDNEFGALASTIGGLADQIAKNFVQGLQNNIENIKRRIQVFDLFAQLTMAKLQKQQEKEMADAESRLQAETQMIKDEEAARLAAFEEAQQARINIIKQRQLDEQALRDEELQAELARLEAEKAAFIEQERIKFEQRQLELLDKTETQAQERLVKETNEQDWLAFVEQVNNDFLQRQFETSQQFKNQETVANDEYKMQIAQTEKEVTKNMEAEKAASDARIKAQEQKQADELNAIKKRQEEERTQTEKKAAGIRWLMEIGNLEATKRLQLAQASIQLAAGIMGAAATAAKLGPFGIPYFAAMSGLLYGTYAMSRATISSQFVLPPAELLMEDGGLLGGSRHSNGGTRIEAERGELFIDRERTARLFETMDNGGMGATIQIMPGAIVVHGNMDESMVEMLAEKIGRQIDRRAF